MSLRIQDRLRCAVEKNEEESEYREPLDEEPGDTFALVEIGDKVTTPDGPGEVIDIALHGADYGNGHVEIEPPSITVKLEDGTEVVTCLCVLELENEEDTALLRSEYKRLWPPVDELPGKAHQLIDDEKIEEQMKNKRSYLDKRYMRAQRWATHTITAEGPLTPGVVLEELEGVDIGKGAIVVDVSISGDEQTVKIYMPETEDTKTVKLPLDSTYRALDVPEKKLIPNTVYDEEVIESGEPEGAIRWVPDSYLPKNPNYPSSLSDALWRPTYRQYPRYPGGTWAMTNDEAKRALNDLDFVQFSKDNINYIGTVMDVQGDTAAVDVIGYKNDASSKWLLKLFGTSEVPVSQLFDANGSSNGHQPMNRQVDDDNHVAMKMQATTNDDAVQAQRNGDFVTYYSDGVEYIGTVLRVANSLASVDVVGHRKNSNTQWTSKVMGLAEVPVENLSLYRRAFREGAAMKNKQADYGSAYDYETAERDDPYDTEEDWTDFPQITERDVVQDDWDPDLQPSPDRLYENPLALFDPDKSPKKMYDLASDLWQEYQTYRHKKVPGVTYSHGNMPFEYYCFIFAQDHDLSLDQMDELWDYMEEIGFMTMRERRQYDDVLKSDELLYRLKLYRNGK